jgi:hypothetical protein
MQSSSTEMAAVCRRLCETLEVGRSTTVRLSGQTIIIPSNADVICKFESGAVSQELSIRVTWGVASSTSQLIRQHSETVQDALGNLYDVFIYGEQRRDGTWEGWIEFVPLNAALPSRRTERETTQPDISALEYWATGLESMYLAGAFERAS